jgi:hypothetical protein
MSSCNFNTIGGWVQLQPDISRLRTPYFDSFSFHPPWFFFLPSTQKVLENKFRSFFRINFSKIYIEKIRKMFPKIFQNMLGVGRETVPYFSTYRENRP